VSRNQRQEHFEEASLVFEFTVFPFWRITKLLASKIIKEKFYRNQSSLIFDMAICAFWFAVFYMLGRCDLFGYHFTIFWQLSGVIIGILLVAFIIGYLRRKFDKKEPKILIEDEPARKKPINRAEYRTVSNGLESLGYKPLEAKKAADYVFQKFNESGTDIKMIEAIKYFGKEGKL
jgi:hypothetical protein